MVKTILSPIEQAPGEVSLRSYLQNVKPGIYFVKIKVGKEERVTKLIVSE